MKRKNTKKVQNNTIDYKQSAQIYVEKAFDIKLFTNSSRI